ncbi:MAG: ribosome maturation factor RimP [Syntrophales bacterium]|nr:ribosome maturation factor RimP [Syntrophales bacterium]
MAAGTYGARIREIIEPVVESEGLELIDVECHRGKARWLVRIYIDCERGVNVDDCAKVSHLAGDVLSVYDVPPGPYDLEVSSPGLDRPLVRDKDFVACLGKTVKIRTRDSIDGRKNFKGCLVDYVAEEAGRVIVVDIEGKHYRIPRNLIDRANLKYEP